MAYLVLFISILRTKRFFLKKSCYVFLFNRKGFGKERKKGNLRFVA